MFCCKSETVVPDLASGIKQTALQETRRKRILGNAYFLVRCANPCGFDDVVVAEEEAAIKIYYCGDLVFHWKYILKRYICGDWTSILDNKVKTIKAHHGRIKTKDRKQLLANKIAANSYVVCLE
jgi:hypothetical protein